ncbi:MAG: hypothetical protein GY801_45685, partial [bacterium]|nr:hypothetical protein [bacterium]
LEQWGQDHPVAIAQMLPQQLWDATVLSEAIRVNLQATAMGCANTQLMDDLTEEEKYKEISAEVKMPIGGCDKIHENMLINLYSPTKEKERR